MLIICRNIDVNKFVKSSHLQYNKIRMTSTIKTAIRVRPFLKQEVEQGYKNSRLRFNQDKREVQVQEQSNKKIYRFDYLFTPQNSQSQIYAQCGIDNMINKALEGYHSTIFAYGQTGSGKTFTMQGQQYSLSANELTGIIPKVAASLYQMVNKSKATRTYTISISFLQIYSQKIYDLLNPSSLNNRSLSMNSPNIEGLRLRWNKDEQFTVQNLFLFQCKNSVELMRYFSTGLKNRINGTHKLNVMSSRSHSIFSIKIQSFEHTNPSHIRVSKIELVDLAGSQRLSLTGTEGKQAKQSIDINKSLFTLRQVINVLSQNANPRTKKEDKVYVPYRDSKLTSILKQSIGGNSYCLMIACINPNDSFLDENISTLTYATKASYITNNPVVNDDPRVKIIIQLKRQIRDLNSELDKANQHIELISTLNESKQHKNPSKSKDMSKQRDMGMRESDLPLPIFKNKQPQKINSYDNNISERLIQSINMVRQLLESNKELRQKVEQCNRAVDQKDVEIFQLTRENQILRQGGTLGSRLPSSQTNQSKRLSLKVQSLNKPPPLNQYDLDSISATRPPLLFPSSGISLDMNHLHLNQKGIDSAPTNFNKRFLNTSQEKRAAYSRGNSSQQDRHAITAKFSKRTWLTRDGDARNFLSLYEDIKRQPV